MRLPICVFDLESDMLCPSCQERLDNGEIKKFDIDFSKWIIEKAKEYPGLEQLDLLRAIKTERLLILVVKKKNKEVLLGDAGLMEEIENAYGKTLVLEGPAKLRTILRELIYPAVEVGVNSLYLPNGFKESIVMLRPEDRGRITYSKDELRAITSAVVGESVLFQYQDERSPKLQESEEDEFSTKLKQFSSGRFQT